MPQYPSAGSTFDPIWHDPLQAMSAFAHRSRESKTIHFPRFLSLLGGGASRSWASCEAAGLARGDEVMASRQHKPLLVGGISTAALAGGESQIRAHRRLKERGSRRRRSSSAKELRSRHRPARRSRGGARGSTVVEYLFGQLLEPCFACLCPTLIFGSKFKALLEMLLGY